MIDIPELKPCPFCGGEPIVERQGDRRQSHIIYCGECGCRLETGETWNAGQLWNTRTEPQVKPLVWVETRHKSPDQLGIRSGAIGINYVIISALMRDNSILSSGGSANIGPFHFDTIDAAKAAAQADYTRRILDALA